MDTGSTESIVTNPNHLKFIDEYFRSGLNATKAYMTVYPGSSYEAAQNSAFRLMRNDDMQVLIQKRYAEIRQATNVDFNRMLKELEELIDGCKVDNDRKHLLKAIELMSRLQGYFAPIKTEQINSAPVQINIIAPPGYVEPGPKLFPKIDPNQDLNPGEI